MQTKGGEGKAAKVDRPTSCDPVLSCGAAAGAPARSYLVRMSLFCAVRRNW